MFEHLDIWLLLAGLGIFLFGIRLIEDSIAKLGGKGFKRVLREGTSTRLRAIITGTGATALLQSSSAVTLMALAFVGAGFISLQNGIGVVLGSNIGTTATSWIVATIGFKLDIEKLALPFIGVGGLILIFLGKSPRYSQVSHLLVGFGFLFMGLDRMKESVAEYAEHFDPVILADAQGWVFVVVGIVLTALMQSSSATVAVLLTALYADLFDLREGALAIVGSNVGTTVTVFLGALGGTVVKKRLAWSHLCFNVFAAVVAIAALPLYMRVVYWALGHGSDPVMGLALFHTLFNLIGVLVFVPFVPRFTALVERIVPERVERRTRFIGEIAPEVAEAAVPGVANEVRQLLIETLAFELDLLEIETRLVLSEGAQVMDRSRYATYHDHYTELKRLQGEIIAFVTQVERHELAEAESRSLNRSVHAARLAIYSAKSLKDVKANIDAFEDAGAFQQRFHGLLRKRIMRSHMKLTRILEDVGPNAVTELAMVLRQLEQDDAAGMREVNLAAREHQLDPVGLSTALQVNQALVRATHDLSLAIAELVLTPEEFATLERVQEVEEALGPHAS